MPAYTITEPHPTLPANSYTHSGRGGAGNLFRVSTMTSPSGVPSTQSPSTAPAQRFYSGRGGAGNVHSASERVTLNFGDEYAAAAARERSQSHSHVGRGGAGNVYVGADDASTKSDSSSRRDSSSTAGSIRSGFWARLSHH